MDGGSARVKEMREAIVELFQESGLSPHFESRVSEGFSDQSEAGRRQRILELEEVVVFSLEIQQPPSPGRESGDEENRHSGWGDVFVKVGDEYVFLFTLYTANYVEEQFRRHGERVKPSPSDIILKREVLGAPDIIRAVIKWVNLYSPGLAGMPISLENPSVLQTLVCDPGVEITCSSPA